MVDIKKLLAERGEVHKFTGIAPEGFVLVHEKTLEQLKQVEVWEDWKRGNLTIQEMNKINFDGT